MPLTESRPANDNARTNVIALDSERSRRAFSFEQRCIEYLAPVLVPLAEAGPAQREILAGQLRTFVRLLGDWERLTRLAAERF